MARRRNKPELTLSTRLILLVVCLVSCGFVYAFVSSVLAISDANSSSSSSDSVTFVDQDCATTTADQGYGGGGGCCRGIDYLELWGSTVKLSLNSTVLNVAATLVNPCVLGKKGRVCVIHGCFVGFVRLVDPNLVSVG